MAPRGGFSCRLWVRCLWRGLFLGRAAWASGALLWLGFAPAGAALFPRPGALLRWWPWGSPLRPSRPRRPRWGLRGSVRPPALGAPAPGPAGLPAAAGCFRSVQNFGQFGLDFCLLPWYSVLVRPVPLLRGLPLAWYPWTAGKAQSKDWAFFLAFFRLRRLCRGSDSPAVNWISRTRCGLLPPVNNPEIVNLILISRFVGGLSCCPRPANATKPLSFCCVRSIDLLLGAIKYLSSFFLFCI